MKKIGNFWYDDRGNSWDCESEEEAERLSKTLVDCRDCRDCSNCSDCRYTHNKDNV